MTNYTTKKLGCILPVGCEPDIGKKYLNEVKYLLVNTSLMFCHFVHIFLGECYKVIKRKVDMKLGTRVDCCIYIYIHAVYVYYKIREHILE